MQWRIQWGVVGLPRSRRLGYVPLGAQLVAYNHCRQCIRAVLAAASCLRGRLSSTFAACGSKRFSFIISTTSPSPKAGSAPGWCHTLGIMEVNWNGSLHRLKKATGVIGVSEALLYVQFNMKPTVMLI